MTLSRSDGGDDGKGPVCACAAWPLSAGSDAMRLLATATGRSGWKKSRPSKKNKRQRKQKKLRRKDGRESEAEVPTLLSRRVKLPSEFRARFAHGHPCAFRNCSGRWWVRSAFQVLCARWSPLEMDSTAAVPLGDGLVLGWCWARASTASGLDRWGSPVTLCRTAGFLLQALTRTGPVAAALGAVWESAGR